MTETASPFGHGVMESFILKALVRKLVAKGVLSPDDIRALLLDAGKDLELDVAVALRAFLGN